MPLLAATDLSVSFGGLCAVDGVNLKVLNGEVVGLIGPNGAGKTTLFNLLAGSLKPARGQVEFRGVQMLGFSPWVRARMGIGRTFQLVQIFQGMTVRQTLAVASHRHTRSGVLADALRVPRSRRAVRAAEERADCILAFLGLEPLADVPAAALPLGQARMLELGRALCSKPRLLMLDEPASGMDLHESEGFVELLRRVRDSFDLSILLVEHDMRVVMGLCDYLYVLNFGRLIAQGAPGDVARDPEVVRAYLGESATVGDPAASGKRPARTRETAATGTRPARTGAKAGTSR